LKLYYFAPSEAARNFGDALNPWMWPQLLNGYLDQDPTAAFIGIGTLLNDRLREKVREAARIVVLGAGAGYGPKPVIDETWHIYSVRGPLTADRLGIGRERVSTDSAALIRTVYQPSLEKQHDFAYMPHFRHGGVAAWRIVARRLGIGFVDPTLPVSAVLEGIATTKVLVTEALHGAVVADALRVPWIAVRGNDRVNAFKWQDWCASLDLAYEPLRVPSLQPRTRFERALRAFKLGTAARELTRVLETAHAHLSDDDVLDARIRALQESVEEFKRDVSLGVFGESRR
jgi:succinoglycan biosynthesis protein ExoV